MTRRDENEPRSVTAGGRRALIRWTDHTGRDRIYGPLQNRENPDPEIAKARGYLKRAYSGRDEASTVVESVRIA